MSNFTPGQKEKVEAGLAILKNIVATELKPNYHPQLITHFMENMAELSKFDISWLIRSDSPYREYLVSVFNEIKDKKRPNPTTELKNKIQKLEATIMLQNHKIEIRDRIIENLNIPQVEHTDDTGDSSPKVKNWLKEFEDTCHVLKAMVNHFSSLGVTIHDGKILDMGNIDGIPRTVAAGTQLKAYLKWLETHELPTPLLDQH